MVPMGAAHAPGAGLVSKQKHRHVPLRIHGGALWDLFCLTLADQVKICHLAVLEPVGVNIGVNAGTNFKHLEIVCILFHNVTGVILYMVKKSLHHSNPLLATVINLVYFHLTNSYI